MVRMPEATWSPVSDDNSKLPMKRWDIVCVHTIVGHDPAGAAHFSTGSDGKITQSRDTAVQSAANYQGNYRVIAIENEDFGPEYGTWFSPNVPGFTAVQAEAIARICAWAHQVHGIPLELCPDSKPTSRGIGYHRQGIDGNWTGFAYGGRVPGGEVWTTKPGKICPGDRRIRQLINDIIPRARVLAGLQEDNDMNGEQDRRQFNADRVLSALLDPANPGRATGIIQDQGGGKLATVDLDIPFVKDLSAMKDVQAAQQEQLDAIKAQVDAIAAHVLGTPL